MISPPYTHLDIVTTRRGVTELRRRWEAVDPWASLLIIHGLGEHSGQHHLVGARLAAAGIDTRAFDLEGFGGSGGNRADQTVWSFYLDQIMDNLASLFHQNLPVVVLGHSMGGLLALDYALSRHRQPDLLVLNAPATDAVVPAWKRKYGPILAQVLPTLNLSNPFDLYQIFKDPAVAADYIKDPLSQSRTTVRLGTHMLGAMKRVNSSLHRFTTPCLLTHGEDDTLIPPYMSLKLGQLPNVERRVYQRIRHASLQEREGGVIVEDIVAWIRDRVGL